MGELDIFKAHEIIDKYINFDALWEKTVGFYDHEKCLGLRHWRKSALFGINEFKKAGIKTDVLEIPADGKTVALDHIMPMGWDCSFAKLELVDNAGKSELLVDSLTEPLCIGLFSRPTPKEGIVAEIVPDHTYGRTPWKDKFIFSTQNVDAAKELRKKINDTGALGLISAWNDLYFEAPDSHKFLNSFTSTPGWYPPADEPPIIVFSVSPRQGKRIADRLASGRCRIRATVRGKLGKDTFLAVSGSIPGKYPAMPETLGVAHMYEPFPTDDASGCAAAIEILSAIKRAIENKELPQPKRTIKMLLTWEHYGVAYYFDKFRRKKGRFLTAVNLDNAGEAFHEEPMKIFHSPAVLPWGGDYCWLALGNKILTEKFARRYQYKEVRGHCGDDCFLSQPAYGVPTMWLLNAPGRYHHNTSITLDKVDPELLCSAASLSGAYLYFMAYAGELEAKSWAEGIAYKARDYIAKAIREKPIDYEKAEFEADYYARQVESLSKIEERPSPDYKRYLAAKAFQIRKLIPKYKRKTIVTQMIKRAKNCIVALKDPACLPYDQARMPVNKRQGRYNCNSLLNWCDGKRDLAEALRLLGLETARKYDDNQICKFLKALTFLAKAGYVELKELTVLAEKDLITAFKKGGIQKGDTLFVHSSLTGLGKIEGGPAAVVRALRTVIGENGLLSMPAYVSCSYSARDGKPNSLNFVPFEPKHSPTDTGTISDFFWRQPGVLRGTNPVHSTAAEGPGAGDLLEGDDEQTPCCSLKGPLGNVILKDGKFVFLGTGMYCCTFLHAIEDACNLPYLGEGRAVIKEDAVIRDIPLMLYPDGTREFYKMPDNECFRKLRKHGLKRKVVKIGFGEIEIITARNLAVSALRMLADDPLAMAADAPFNPVSVYKKETHQRKGRIRKLLLLAEEGKWEQMIEKGYNKP